MAQLKQFFEKYLSYFILALLIFISFFNITFKLLTVGNLMQLLEIINSSRLDTTYWSFIANWFIKLITFLVIGIFSIIVLVKKAQNNNSNRSFFAFNYVSLAISFIMLEITICNVLMLIESKVTIGDIIMNLLFVISIGVLFLLSCVIKSKAKFILSLIGYSLMLILFASSTISLIVSSLLQSSLSRIELLLYSISCDSIVEHLAFVFLSLIGIVFSTFYMAIDYTSKSIEVLKE